jgi:hypothetical protein
MHAASAHTTVMQPDCISSNRAGRIGSLGKACMANTSPVVSGAAQLVLEQPVAPLAHNEAKRAGCVRGTYAGAQPLLACCV